MLPQVASLKASATTSFTNVYVVCTLLCPDVLVMTTIAWDIHCFLHIVDGTDAQLWFDPSSREVGKQKLNLVIPGFD
ncbi:hypothetical protein NUACC21_78680 [Scytonema sp. NUACC21]